MTEKKNTPITFTDTINIYDGLDLSLDDSFDLNSYAKTILNETANIELESKHTMEKINLNDVEKQGEQQDQESKLKLHPNC